MSEDHSESIALFVSMTGAEESVASALLEAHGWNVEAAMNTFLDDGPAAPPAPSGGGGGGGRGGGRPRLAEEDDFLDDATPSTAAFGQRRPAPEVQAKPAGPQGGPDVGPDVDMIPDESEGEKSILDRILDKADKVKPPTETELERERKKRQVFSGTGYTLTGQPAAQQPVVRPPVPTEPPKARDFKVTLWKDGYSVDGAAVRPYDTPEGQEFMSDMERGYAPRELRNVDEHHRPVPVNIMLEDKREEMSPPPPKPRFPGQGHTLAPAAATTAPAAAGGGQGAGSGGVWAAASAVGSAVGSLASWVMPGIGQAGARVGETQGGDGSGPLVVDPTLPTTVIQVRTPDGKRHRGEFNTTHTVNALVRWAAEQASVAPGSVCTLVGGYPPAAIQDQSLTLEAAGLCNSAVTLRVQ